MLWSQKASSRFPVVEEKQPWERTFTQGDRRSSWGGGGSGWQRHEARTAAVRKKGKRLSSRRLVVKITRGNRVFFVTTHCSLLSHITESYKQQHAVQLSCASSSRLRWPNKLLSFLLCDWRCFQNTMSGLWPLICISQVAHRGSL